MHDRTMLDRAGSPGHPAPPFRQPSPRGLAGPAILLFTVSCLALGLCMEGRVGLYDEGIILFGAERVANGDLLHRDFYANYGPGQFYSLALLFKLLSPSVLAGRLLDTAERAAVVVLVFLLVAGSGSRIAAWLAALGTLVWMASLGFYGYPVFPALACALASLFLLLPALRGAPSAPRLLAAGLCAGVGALFRYDVGVSVFVAEGAVLGLCALSQGRAGGKGRSGLIRMAWPFCAGLGLIVVPLAAAYAAAGVLGDFVLDIVTYPSRSYPRMRSLPFPTWSTLQDRPEWVSVYLPVLACAAAVPAILALARRQGDTGLARQLWTLAALVALTLAFVAKGLVRISPIHMAMALVASLALVAVLWTARRGLGRLAWWSAVVGVIATAACTILAGALAATDRQVAWLMAPLCHPPAGLGRLACFELDQPRVEAIQYVQRHTGPGEAIFVGPGRHDKVFINDVMFYFLAGRRAATKWHHMDPGLQTTAPIQRAMIADLTRERPPLVVLDSEWDAVAEPNASALSSGVTLLDDYLRSHFTPVATFGTITVLRATAPGDLGPQASP